MSLNVKRRRFTVDEYARMGDAGIFAPDERVELIEGEIIKVSPQNPPHARLISRLTTRLVKLFGDTHEIRVQLPLTLGMASEPEPDFSLVRLENAEGPYRHPDVADLVIEIADSSLRFDRRRKASLYAKFGLPDYWILNTRHQRVEVHRAPTERPESAYGWDYSHLTVMARGQTVSPLRWPEVSFTVEELTVP